MDIQDEYEDVARTCEEEERQNFPEHLLNSNEEQDYE